MEITSDRHSLAFQRMAASSKKLLPDLLKAEAKIIFTNVAKFTPPASAGVTGRAAGKQGRDKVAADIRSLYGTPSDAYEAIHTPAKASAFWFLHQQHDDTAAQAILREAAGKSFGPFDDGTLHRRNPPGRSRRRRRDNRDAIYFVTDPAALSAYIVKEQGHVWWMASGWREGLQRLGAKLPTGVGSLPAPGYLKVIITGTKLEITMGNEVKFARQVRDIERRVQWAINRRADALDRMWKAYIDKLANTTGLRRR